MQKKILFFTLIMILLAGCLPAQSEQDISSLVNTAVAETARANTEIASIVEQTLAAQQPAFTPTAEFSPTPDPTFETFILFTDTPFPTATPFPTNTFSPAAAPTEKKPYACYVQTRSPGYLEEVRAGGNFEVKWFVVNTGTREWQAGMDLKYASGTNMIKGERFEIPVAILPGATYKVNLDAKAPNKPGTYTMTWIVEGPLCYANVTIIAK